MNQFAPNTTRASLEVARVALGRMAGAPPPPNEPRTLPVTMAVRAGDAWKGVEQVLRAVTGGTELAGQALLAEARRVDMLDMDSMHALVALREWVERTLAPGSAAQVLTLAPTEAEKEVARNALVALERLAGVPGTAAPAADTATVAELPAPPLPPLPSPWAPQSTPGVAPPAFVREAPAKPARGVDADRTAPANLAPIGQMSFSSPVESQPRSRSSALIMAAVALTVILAGAGAWYVLDGRERMGTNTTDQGVAAYARGSKEAARLAFVRAIEKNPDDVRALTYLGRIERELGNLATARKYLENAIRIEPGNALALREFASALLADEQPELARNFYVRAVQANPGDRTAQGFLGCALMRLGRADEAAKWMARAGAGPWDRCTSSAPPQVAPPVSKD